MSIIRKSNKTGFSLAEFMITLGLLMVLTASLFGTLTLSMRYYRQSNYSTDLQKAVRDSVEYMTDEIRQAVPDEDPGMLGNNPTGYKMITPAVSSNGIMYPNMNDKDTDYVMFTKPDYDYFDPGSSTWEPFDPRNYKRIRYYVKDINKLIREVTTFKADGTVKDKTSDELAVVQDGTITLECTMFTPGSTPSYCIQVTVVRDDKSYSLKSGCLVPGSAY
ncbi:MAG: hypothetical protein LWY06_11825 [Firmicutes bacterium]|nr:hypothetical protein [Bacillota bacterium]